MATTDTEKTPAGAVQSKVPAVANTSCPAATNPSLVSFIVIELLVANIGPTVEPDLTDAVKVSAPSVFPSAVAVTVNWAVCEFISTLPDDVSKSPEFVTDQYLTVPSGIDHITLIVKVTVDPSSTDAALDTME